MYTSLTRRVFWSRAGALLCFSSFPQSLSAQNNTKPAANSVAPGVPSSGSGEAAVKAAIITASFTVGGILFKDLLLKLWEERRALQREESAVYDRYSKPLAASACSLLIRLNEIVLQKHRPVYLKSAGFLDGKGQGSAFRVYKKLSTLYRLATLIGWIRACRREYSFVRVAASRKNERIDEAIAAFEKALADGSWVERERVLRLVDVWKLQQVTEVEKDAGRLEELGVLVDNAIYDNLESNKAAELFELDPAGQQKICVEIAGLLARQLNTNPVSGAMMKVTWPVAFGILSMREAWIYKDWQDAIGDMMLRRVEGEDRKFEVLGFYEFEKLCSSTDHEQRPLIQRLADILDQLDLSITQDRFDARPRQLRALARANANLVQAMHAAQSSSGVISDRLLDLAKTVLDKVKAERL